MKATIIHKGKKVETSTEEISELAGRVNYNRELPGMPDAGPLRNAAEDFVEQRGIIEEEKEKLEQVGQRILDAMKKEGRYEFAIVTHGERYKFSIKEAAVKLQCTKLNNRVSS